MEKEEEKLKVHEEESRRYGETRGGFGDGPVWRGKGSGDQMWGGTR